MMERTTIMLLSVGLFILSISSASFQRRINGRIDQLTQELSTIENRQFQWQQKASQGGYYEPLIALSNNLMVVIQQAEQRMLDAELQDAMINGKPYSRKITGLYGFSNLVVTYVPPETDDGAK